MCPVCNAAPCLATCELLFVRNLREVLREKAAAYARYVERLGESRGHVGEEPWYAKLFH